MFICVLGGFFSFFVFDSNGLSSTLSLTLSLSLIQINNMHIAFAMYLKCALKRFKKKKKKSAHNIWDKKDMSLFV